MRMRPMASSDRIDALLFVERAAPSRSERPLDITQDHAREVEALLNASDARSSLELPANVIGPRRSVRGRARSLAVQWTCKTAGRREAGMSTAEYAVGTIAACGFAALLFKVVTSPEVGQMLSDLVKKAFGQAG